MPRSLPDGDAKTSRRIGARAHALGSRLSIRELPGRAAEAVAPLILPAGKHGRMVPFRFGAVVFLAVAPDEEQSWLDRLAEHVVDPFRRPGREDAEIIVDPTVPEGPDPQGRIVLHDLDAGRAQVVASVLAKSAALAHHEENLAATFDRVEALAVRLRGSRRWTRSRDLLRQIGSVLVTQARMVGRVEVSEKPEITWDDPGLDRLYERLAAEFELGDRDRALSRKLELISDIAGTYLELIHSRASLRLEWYIVILILVEIALSLYEMFGH